MRDQEIRAALDRHWAASDANDFDAYNAALKSLPDKPKADPWQGAR